MPREPAARLKRGAQKKGGQQWRTSSPNPALEPKTRPVWTSVRSIVIHPAKSRSYDDGRPTFDEVPQLYIDPTECIDCGACVPVCPVTAIFPLEDLPKKWQAYTAINASYVVGGKFQPDKFQIKRG